MGVMDSFGLGGKVAMITGGARHLGYDMADALAEAGADLVISSREQASAQAAAAKLQAAHGVDVLAVGLDVTDPANVETVVARAWDWKGHVDILINNAGGTPGASSSHLFERSTQDMIDLVRINLLGSMFCCQAVSKRMKDLGYGKIINIASIAGLVGRDRRMYQRSNMKGQPIDYAAAKAGVIGMTMDLAGLLSPMGIRVNAISPGGFGPRQLPDSFFRDYSDRTPLGHMGRDGLDIKGAALFLASPASDYVTGHNLVVDGGFSIWH